MEPTLSVEELVMREYANAYHPTSGVSDYPFAPMDWSERAARRKAREEGLELSAYHLEVIRVLQAYFFSHEREGVDIRDLHTALHETFQKRVGFVIFMCFFHSVRLFRAAAWRAYQYP